ncbi:unnamed protein product [Paramecium pentaurelia]|uniref:Transmembrane protein n=1 Tax=Paramecium pentaurelia TaxID=43138 RepID=A0A8S1U7S9_9CILI|nr:unnamed protein product [Paramecium pentaurelia]
MIRKFIKKVDLLVDPYEFNISQKEKSLTPLGFILNNFLGGFISIVLLVFASFYIVGVFQKSIQNQNTIYAGTQSDQNQEFALSHDNTIFSIELSTLDGKILNDNTNVNDYFSLTAQYIQQQRIEGKIGFTRNYTALNQSKCSKEKVKQFNFNSASMTEEQKENLICFDGNFTLQGQFYEPYFAYVKLTVSVCNNSTRKTCKTSKEIENFINKGVNVDMFIKGSKIKQSLNSSSPADLFSTNIFWRLTTGIGDNEDIYMQPLQMDLKKIQFFSDIFNIENSERLYNGSVVERQERRQEPISISSGIGLCTFYLRASSDSSFYFVIQQDLPSTILSAVSETTALFLAVMQIIKIFYRVYNQHKTFEILMNSVFKFDLKSVQKRKLSQVNQSQTPGKVQQSEKNSKKQLQQIFDYTIKYSFYQYILYIIRKYFKSCKKIEDEKELVISQIAKSKIEFDLDLTNILKKLYEIDCLKLFFFDDDQLMLFNSFCSPVFQDQMTDQKELFDILTASYKQTRSINQLQQQNQANIDNNNQNIIKYAATSEIPINIRLAKLTRFFKAQLGAENAEELVDNFQKVNENKNKNCQLNDQLIQFAKQNKSLFNLVQQNYSAILHQQNEEEQRYLEDQIILDVPNELEYGRKNSEIVGSKDQGQSLKDLDIQQSPDCFQNRLQQI